ncbi:hypothetical protein VCSRO185_3463 [Vibrio cholerae]|nr:hypothetical protein VCSRO185_3463 [Vibrio cholerae]
MVLLSMNIIERSYHQFRTSSLASALNCQSSTSAMKIEKYDLASKIMKIKNTRDLASLEKTGNSYKKEKIETRKKLITSIEQYHQTSALVKHGLYSSTETLNNYRAMVINDSIICGSSRPDWSTNDVNQWLSNLSDNNTKIVLALAPNNEVQTSAHKYGITYIPLLIENDNGFGTPSIEFFEYAWSVLESNKIDSGNVLIHCGEGMGRTGTMLAAIKLKDMFLNNKTKSQTLNETIKLGHYETIDNRVCKCSSLVKDAINYVRSLSVESSNSVEMKKQVERLNEYEKYLMTKFR